MQAVKTFSCDLVFYCWVFYTMKDQNNLCDFVHDDPDFTGSGFKIWKPSI